MFIAFLGGLDHAIVIVGIRGEISAAPREEVWLEGDGAAVEVGVVLQNPARILKHEVGRVEMAVDQPGGVVGGHFHLVKNVVHAQDGVLELVRGPVNSLFADGLPRHAEHVTQCGNQDDGGKKDSEKAHARGQRPFDEGQDSEFHGYLAIN